MTAEGDKSSSQAEFPAQIRRPGQLHILENELKATRAERDNALQLQGQWKEELVQEQRRAAILETNLKYAHEKIEEYKQNIDVLKRNNDLLVQENKDLQGSLHQKDQEIITSRGTISQQGNEIDRYKQDNVALIQENDALEKDKQNVQDNSNQKAQELITAAERARQQQEEIDRRKQENADLRLAAKKTTAVVAIMGLFATVLIGFGINYVTASPPNEFGWMLVIVGSLLVVVGVFIGYFM